MTIFAGLDVHKKKCHGVIVEEDGEVLKDEEFDNSLLGVRTFFQGFHDADAVIEASYSWRPAYERLEKIGIQPKLAHPGEVEAIASSETKTDSIDVFGGTEIEPRIAKDIERPRSESVLCTKVCKEIRTSELCIADVTRDNINVGLEVGLAWRYGKPVIITMNKNERSKLPSDFSGFEVIFYEDYDQLQRDFEDKIDELF